MSRSTRSSPVCGITTARSEKKDKQLWHRSFRSISRQRLVARLREDPMGEGFLDVSFREVSSTWNMAKDGKAWRGDGGWWMDPDDPPEVRQRHRRMIFGK